MNSLDIVSTIHSKTLQYSIKPCIWTWTVFSHRK